MAACAQTLRRGRDRTRGPGGSDHAQHGQGCLIEARKPGLTIQEFQKYWYEGHAPLVAKLPGLRRYVQNHGIPEAYPVRTMTHDGFAELWFDDLAALQRAAATAEWQAIVEDGKELFAEPTALIIARERIQKDF